MTGPISLKIDPKNFSRPTIIDNKYMPLKPGSQQVYEGWTMDEGKKIPHKVIQVVTDLVKEINELTRLFSGTRFQG